MCLTRVFSDEKAQSIVDELPEVAPGVVELSKVVGIGSGFYKSRSFYRFIFKQGMNRAETETLIMADDCKRYFSGIHFFANLNAEIPLYLVDEVKIVKCYLKKEYSKEWISSVGMQSYRQGKFIVLVASQAFFPTYPATEPNLDEFLEYLRKEEKEIAQCTT